MRCKFAREKVKEPKCETCDYWQWMHEKKGVCRNTKSPFFDERTLSNHKCCRFDMDKDQFREVTKLMNMDRKGGEQ